jgi:hypothetical protein
MSKDAPLSDARQRLLAIQKRGGLTPAGPAASSEKSRTIPEGPVPLSFSQEQVWRLDQTAARLAPLHNESITIHRHGLCDIPTLERSFAEIIRRHQIACQ